MLLPFLSRSAFLLDHSSFWIVLIYTKLYQILRIYNFSFLPLKHSMKRIAFWSLFHEGALGVWAIVDKELDKMIGVVRFEKIDVQKRTAELGYFLNASYWGRGLMTEAVTCLSDLALTAMGMDRIILIASFGK